MFTPVCAPSPRCAYTVMPEADPSPSLFVTPLRPFPPDIAGKYLGVRRDVAMLASDRSPGLAAQAASRLLASTAGPACGHADVAVADAMALPYRQGAFDAALCIAVCLA